MADFLIHRLIASSLVSCGCWMLLTKLKPSLPPHKGVPVLK